MEIIKNYIIAIICCLTDIDWWFPYHETRGDVWRDYLAIGKAKRKN